MVIFRFFTMEVVWRLGFLKFKILSVIRVKRVNLRHLVKFHGDRSDHCWDIAIFSIFSKMAACVLWNLLYGCWTTREGHLVVLLLCKSWLDLMHSFWQYASFNICELGSYSIMYVVALGCPARSSIHDSLRVKSLFDGHCHNYTATIVTVSAKWCHTGSADGCHIALWEFVVWLRKWHCKRRNTFKTVYKFWSDQEVLYDYKAGLRSIWNHQKA